MYNLFLRPSSRRFSNFDTALIKLIKFNKTRLKYTLVAWRWTSEMMNHRNIMFTKFTESNARNSRVQREQLRKRGERHWSVLQNAFSLFLGAWKAADRPGISDSLSRTKIQTSDSREQRNVQCVHVVNNDAEKCANTTYTSVSQFLYFRVTF